jgi:hypothetical protein
MIVVYLVGAKPFYLNNSMIMKILFVVAFLITSLWSCKSKTAFEYSERIVKMEKDLARDITGAEEKVSRFLKTEQNDSAKLIAQQVEDMTNATLKDVQNLAAPNVAEAENFKKEAINYFTYIKEMYTSFNRFVKAGSDEAKEVERLKLAKIFDEKDEATKAMQSAQQKFAEANNFRLEKK